ncbi:MAG TPA: hypothetical protein VHJ37_10975 [Thermoleophilaceae bacterium]|nr:hypothetical protein [Thermoleophilaceae bacterium]
MKSLLQRRPSPALVIACLALFVSLSGVSYGVATGFIDSREIKNNEVRSRDLRNNDIRTKDLRNNEIRGIDIRNSTIQSRDIGLNQVTGTDVRESTLQKVPSAAIADSATTAQSAATAGNVGGLTVRKFFAKVPSGGATTEIFRGSGFVLRGGCSATSAILLVNGIAGAPEANVTFEGFGEGGAAQVFGSDADLDPADNYSLVGANERATGTAVVSTTTGVVSTIVYAAQDSLAFQGENVCALRGTVTSG